MIRERYRSNTYLPGCVWAEGKLLYLLLYEIVLFFALQTLSDYECDAVIVYRRRRMPNGSHQYLPSSESDEDT